MTEELIPEIDMWELDAEIYRVWKLLKKRDYGKAETKIATLWYHVHRFNLDDPSTSECNNTSDPPWTEYELFKQSQHDGSNPKHLRSTEDSDLIALLTKFLYWFLNLFPRRCRKLGYWCEFVYPYGFVPEGGCPIHD